MTAPHPGAEYQERLEAALREAADWTSTADTLANRRGLVFLAGMGAWIVASTMPTVRTAAWAALALLVVVFARLVVLHGRARFRVAWAERIASFNRESLARLERDWDALPEIEVRPEPGHPFAEDLDLFGHASLMTLLGGGSTRPGLETLRSWLLEPAEPDEVRLRQEAVRELAGELDFRERLAARAAFAGPVGIEEVRRLLDWAEEPGWALERPGLTAAAYGLPILTAVTGGLHIWGVVPYLWVLTIMATAWVNRRIAAALMRDFMRVSMGERGLRRYGEIIEEAAGQTFEAERLRTLSGGLRDGETPPSEALARLFRIVELGEARRNFFHPVVDLLFHWDIHVIRAGERWKRRFGKDLRRWLDALGELDALSAVGGLVHAHPDWAFPVFDERPALRAEAVGHPLLPPRNCVRNDVEVGPPGTFLLITGSNMSGKSTLLRSMGLNVVLAGAGAPVCAKALALTPVDLHTSMRVRDDIEEGLSYFMAGLERLRDVVEGARAATTERPVFYMLDEILQGTNTAERRIAARGVIRELLTHSALGAVTTHDLELADAEDLSAKAELVHFVDLPGTPEEPLAFDYRLRPGLATSTNALKLMELMGLRTAEEADPT